MAKDTKTPKKAKVEKNDLAVKPASEEEAVIQGADVSEAPVEAEGSEEAPVEETAVAVEPEHKPAPAAKKKPHKKEEKPLDKMTVKELKEIATEIPHDHVAVAVSDMKKEELLAFIKEARGIADEEPVKKRKKAKVKIVLTKQELKAKLVKLKEEKQAARSAKDKQLENQLRRRISRLKKMTRKIA